MRTKFGSALAGLLVVVSCSSMKISNDYDRNADFAGFKTYSWVEGQTLEGDYPLVHERLVRAIEGQLAMKGLNEADSNPDVFVTYHADENESIRIDTDHFGYGYGPGWYWGGMGMGSSTTRVRSYTQGTLIVDVWDAKQKRLVWRGTATDTVSESPTPQKIDKKVNQAIGKMFESFPPPAP